MCAFNSATRITGCVYEDNNCNTGFPDMDGWGGAIAGIRSSLTIDSCLFIGNIGDRAGAVFASDSSTVVLRNSTFYDNRTLIGVAGAVLRLGYFWDHDLSTAAVENCLLAFNPYGVPVRCQGYSNVVTLTCTDIYGNPDGDWIGPIADQAESNGNFSLDPQFCDTASLDLALNPLSPCLPENNECNTLIGALGEGCDCCVDRGNINHDPTGVIDISDLVYLVAYMFDLGPTPPCLAEGDVDGNGIGGIDISDLVYLVDYMFNGGPAPMACL